MTTEHAHDGGEIDNPHTRHEESDVNIRSIFGFAIALTIVAIVMNVAVWLLFRYYEGREATAVLPQYPLAVPQQDQLPPLPRLQTNPRQDLRDLRAQEDVILSTYGWADKNTGAVRIPIDEAMKLTLQRGLPARPGPAPTAAPSSSGTSNSGRIIGDIGK
jgi:hypothetical protein